MIYAPLILLAVVICLALIPRFVESQRVKTSVAERQGAAGQFAQLSQGITHYAWHGPARGKVIVAVHGLTTPQVVWESMLPGLVAMGYRVLTYDLYGRGLSDAPSGPQDAHFFVRQLNDLLEHEGVSEEITYLGYSMGGAIVAEAASGTPHQAAQVLLVAPSGFKTIESAFSRFCRRVPLIGDWVHSVFAPLRMRASVEKNPSSEHVAYVEREQVSQLHKQGYLRAVLSSRRGLLDQSTEVAHRFLADQGIPVAAVWAGQDSVIPVVALADLAVWNRDALQDVIDDADHRMPYTHGPEVTARLRALIKEA